MCLQMINIRNLFTVKAIHTLHVGFAFSSVRTLHTLIFHISIQLVIPNRHWNDVRRMKTTTEKQ